MHLLESNQSEFFKRGNSEIKPGKTTLLELCHIALWAMLSAAKTRRGCTEKCQGPPVFKGVPSIPLSGYRERAEIAAGLAAEIYSKSSRSPKCRHFKPRRNQQPVNLSRAARHDLYTVSQIQRSEKLQRAFRRPHNGAKMLSTHTYHSG